MVYRWQPLFPNFRILPFAVQIAKKRQKNWTKKSKLNGLVLVSYKFAACIGHYLRKLPQAINLPFLFH